MDDQQCCNIGGGCLEQDRTYPGDGIRPARRPIHTIDVALRKGGGNEDVTRRLAKIPTNFHIPSTPPPIAPAHDPAVHCFSRSSIAPFSETCASLSSEVRFMALMKGALRLHVRQYASAGASRSRQNRASLFLTPATLYPILKQMAKLQHDPSYPPRPQLTHFQPLSILERMPQSQHGSFSRMSHALEMNKAVDNHDNILERRCS